MSLKGLVEWVMDFEIRSGWDIFVMGVKYGFVKILWGNKDVVFMFMREL